MSCPDLIIFSLYFIGNKMVAIAILKPPLAKLAQSAIIETQTFTEADYGCKNKNFIKSGL